VIARAAAEAEHGHKLDRALTAEVAATAVIVGALFPDQGYDLVLARTFAMPGLPMKPGTLTPAGPALSKARVRGRRGRQVLAQSAHRGRPARTSGRTALQCQHWQTEEVTYTITIVPSNLPKADIRPGSYSKGSGLPTLCMRRMSHIEQKTSLSGYREHPTARNNKDTKDRLG
jgi:hypothetical protein